MPILQKDQQKFTFMASTVSVFGTKSMTCGCCVATFFVGHDFSLFLMGMVYEPLYFYRFWSSSQNGGCAHFQWKNVIIVTAFLRLIEVFEPQRGPSCWFSKRRPMAVLSFWTKTHNAKRKKKTGETWEEISGNHVFFLFFSDVNTGSSGIDIIFRTHIYLPLLTYI